MRPVKAVVTGAAQGLGSEIVERLAADGGSVCCVDISPDVHATCDRLRQTYPEAHLVVQVGDVSDEAFCERAIDTARASLGGLNLLVNNAGIGGPPTPVVETELSAFRRVIDVNLIGAFLMARAAAKVMIELAAGGLIVNMGSILGQQGTANGSAYCASKGGIALLTHSLALELAPYDIRVNTIAPGNMATPMHWLEMQQRAEESGTTVEEEVEKIRREIPLARHGTGADVAGTIAFLASKDGAYVTGQTVGVNGGVLLT